MRAAGHASPSHHTCIGVPDVASPVGCVTTGSHAVVVASPMQIAVLPDVRAPRADSPKWPTDCSPYSSAYACRTMCEASRLSRLSRLSHLSRLWWWTACARNRHPFCLKCFFWFWFLVFWILVWYAGVWIEWEQWWAEWASHKGREECNENWDAWKQAHVYEARKQAQCEKTTVANTHSNSCMSAYGCFFATKNRAQLALSFFALPPSSVLTDCVSQHSPPHPTPPNNMRVYVLGMLSS